MRYRTRLLKELHEGGAFTKEAITQILSRVRGGPRKLRSREDDP